MCDKAVDDYSIALEFVPDRDKTISKNLFYVKIFS